MSAPELLTVIAALPPEDGLDWDCQCARCGSSIHTESHDCESCFGEGELDAHDDDPINYPEPGEESEPCRKCRGAGRFIVRRCLSGEDWCRAHPIPGREATETGAIEWFAVRSAP